MMRWGDGVEDDDDVGDEEDNAEDEMADGKVEDDHVEKGVDDVEDDDAKGR